ncbi:MAG: CopG family transcriptional regulator [Candidatus Heimdallarchaeota archaeon]|nr:CopG family transcriptional regulator [Candidatus Heimdallarchaeota archaeon]
MAEYTTISIKIPKEKKKLLEKYRINIEGVIQKALDQEIQTRKKKFFSKKWKEQVRF